MRATDLAESLVLRPSRESRAGDRHCAKTGRLWNGREEGTVDRGTADQEQRSQVRPQTYAGDRRAQARRGFREPRRAPALFLRGEEGTSSTSTSPPAGGTDLVTCLPRRLMSECLEGSRRHLPSPGAEEPGAAEVRRSPLSSGRASHLSVGWNERWAERVRVGTQQVLDTVHCHGPLGPKRSHAEGR